MQINGDYYSRKTWLEKSGLKIISLHPLQSKAEYRSEPKGRESYDKACLLIVMNYRLI